MENNIGKCARSTSPRSSESVRSLLIDVRYPQRVHQYFLSIAARYSRNLSGTRWDLHFHNAHSVDVIGYSLSVNYKCNVYGNRGARSTVRRRRDIIARKASKSK